MSISTYVAEIKQELVAAATKNRLEQLGIGEKQLRSATDAAAVQAPRKVTDALKRVSTSFAFAEAASGKGHGVISNYFTSLEKSSANLERRSFLLRKALSSTTSWVLSVASFGEIWQGLVDLTHRQANIYDIDLRATGTLTDALRETFSAQYEKGMIIARKFNVDAEEIAKSAYEFMHWYNRSPDMRDLEAIAGIARTIGVSYEDVWKQITDRSLELNEGFAEASAGVRDQIASQHDLEMHQRKLNIPRENILGAKAFAEIMHKAREATKNMPKDGRILNRVVVETLKRVTGEVGSKEAQAKMAESMAKLLETDPYLQQQLGKSAFNRIKQEADKIVAEHGGNFDQDRAEVEAINRIFGVAYSAQVQSIRKLQKQGYDEFQAMRDIGDLYAKTPRGVRDTLKFVQDFATVGGMNAQTAQHYFIEKGLDPSVIPEFVKLAITGKLEEIGIEAAKIETDASAELARNEKTLQMVQAQASPTPLSIMGTIKGVRDILLQSPFAKVVGGIGGLILLDRLRRKQDQSIISGLAKVTTTLVEIAVAKGATQVADLLGSTGKTGKLSKFATAGRKLLGGNLAKAVLASLAVGGGIYAYEKFQHPQSESDQKLAETAAKNNIESLTDSAKTTMPEMAAVTINDSGRQVAEQVAFQASKPGPVTSPKISADTRGGTAQANSETQSEINYRYSGKPKIEIVGALGSCFGALSQIKRG